MQTAEMGNELEVHLAIIWVYPIDDVDDNAVLVYAQKLALRPG